MSIRLTIDGREILTEQGRNLLQVCLEAGIDLPYFCWHPAMGSVGACRQCAVALVDEDGLEHIVMGCMTGAEPGLEVRVAASQEAQAFRAQVIEWLMVNHPHDCPVCEEGGSCHLQDMTVMTGHRDRRYRFAKRTHRNQDLGPLLTHEMNRCIACYRCTRFYRDYADGRDLEAMGSAERVYFGRAEEGPLTSPFAGNLAEICPTGVFNDKQWSTHYARKWDMVAAPAVCAHCSLGCNLSLAERGGTLRRVHNRYHAEINGHFLCDRGRYGPAWVDGDRLLTQSLQTGRPAAEENVLAGARAALANGAIALGSPRASLEANDALRRLVGPDRFFAAVPDAELALWQQAVALMQAGPARIATLAEVEDCDAALVVGADPEGAAPRLSLSLRQMVKGAVRAKAAAQGIPDWHDAAVRSAGGAARHPLILAGWGPSALEAVASETVRAGPADLVAFLGDIAETLEETDPRDGPAAVLARAERPLLAVMLDPALSGLMAAVARIAAALGDRLRLVLVPAAANSLGLSLLGPAGGLDAAARALAEVRGQTLIVMESDPFDALAPKAAEALWTSAGKRLVLDHQAGPAVRRADYVLPTAPWHRATGTWVNFEGRAQRSFAVMPAAAEAPAAWRRVQQLAGETADVPLDAVLRDLTARHLHLAGVLGAAPRADHRMAKGKVARAPARYSGRTAQFAHLSVVEPRPPRDPDSPLSFTMEGAGGPGTDPALIPFVKAPGWTSSNALTRFQEEVTGPLRGGPAGVRLIDPGQGSGSLPQGQPAGVRPTAGGLVPVACPDPFAGEALAALSPPLAARAPAAHLLLHPDEAARLGLAEGDRVRLDGQGALRPLRLDPGLAKGCVGLAGAGWPQHRPATVTLHREPAR